jgi:hypothetical protein
MKEQLIVKNEKDLKVLLKEFFDHHLIVLTQSNNVPSHNTIEIFIYHLSVHQINTTWKRYVDPILPLDRSLR